MPIALLRLAAVDPHASSDAALAKVRTATLPSCVHDRGVYILRARGSRSFKILFRRRTSASQRARCSCKEGACGKPPPPAHANGATLLRCGWHRVTIWLSTLA